MKKNKNILPQHIPDGQSFNNESLQVLNKEVRKFGARGLLTIFGTFLVCIVLAIICGKFIGGVIGYCLAALIMIFSPAGIMLSTKRASRKYAALAEKFGLSPEQLNSAIQNRNKNIAAWGELPSETDDRAPQSPEEIKLKKRKKRRRTFLTIGIIAIAAVTGLVAYDFYLTAKSAVKDKIVLEIKNKKTSDHISESDYEMITAIIDKRAELVREDCVGDHKVETRYKYKDGTITCTIIDPGWINDVNCEALFVRGDISIVNKDDQEMLIPESEIKKIEYVESSDIATGCTLAFNLKGNSFTKLRLPRIYAVSLKMGDTIPEYTDFRTSTYNSISTDWLVEKADGNTCFFNNVNKCYYYAYLNQLPFELEVNVLEYEHQRH